MYRVVGTNLSPKFVNYKIYIYICELYHDNNKQSQLRSADKSFEAILKRQKTLSFSFGKKYFKRYIKNSC